MKHQKEQLRMMRGGLANLKNDDQESNPWDKNELVDLQQRVREKQNFLIRANEASRGSGTSKDTEGLMIEPTISSKKPEPYFDSRVKS
jgi:hypothetical protein